MNANDELDRRIGDKLRARYPGPDFDSAAVEARIEEALASGRDDRTTPRGGETPAVDVDVIEMRRPSTAWWERGAMRTVLPVAASLLLFIGGVEYGRRTGAPLAPASSTVAVTLPDEDASGAVSLPISIQSSGSQYVAHMARFAADAGELTEEQRAVSREVGFAVIYSAALELMKESTDDELLRSIVELVSERRNQLDGGEPQPVSF